MEVPSLNVEDGALKMVMSPISSSASGHSGIAPLPQWSTGTTGSCLGCCFQRDWPRVASMTYLYIHPTADNVQSSSECWWVMLSTVRDVQTKPTRVTTGCGSVRSLARSSLVYWPSRYIPILKSLQSSLHHSFNIWRWLARNDHKGHFMMMVDDDKHSQPELRSLPVYPLDYPIKKQKQKKPTLQEINCEVSAPNC